MWVECTGFSLRPSLLGEFNAQLRFVIYACCYACWNKFPLFRHSTLWLNFTTPLNKFVIYNIDRWYYKYWEVLHLNKTDNLMKYSPFLPMKNPKFLQIPIPSQHTSIFHVDNTGFKIILYFQCYFLSKHIAGHIRVSKGLNVSNFIYQPYMGPVFTERRTHISESVIHRTWYLVRHG